MSRTIDRFISTAEIRKRHEILVRAPAELVFGVAENFELQSIPIVRAIFQLRAMLFGARHEPMRKGLVEEMLGIGWGKLAYAPGREVVMGAVTEPWIAEVKFRAIAPTDFADFRSPGLVKIVWTLEAEPLGRALTRFATETRVAPTDETARRKFRAYWRKFGIGAVIIRLLAIPSMKREAERRYKAGAR
ncbi:MAG TPA: hypothetical protein DCP92_01125 [Nitrospiraceae bacterium]|jgi:hypothetical protein|nr:hypothetical protein [Nitrospiraceae bacterium]